MTTTDLDTSTIADRLVTCIQGADYPGVVDYFAPDAVLDMNLPTWRFQYRGADEIRTYFVNQTGGSTNLHCTQLTHLTGFDCVMIESECRFDGDDGEYLWRCVDIFTVIGGRVSRHTQYCTGCWSPADIARQADEAPMIAW